MCPVCGEIIDITDEPTDEEDSDEENANADY